MDADGRLVPAAGLLLRVWDDDLGVAYLPASGSTHLLAAEACRILAQALESPAGVAAGPSGPAPTLIDGLLAAGLLQRLE